MENIIGPQPTIQRPTRKLVDITFWGSHIAIAVSFLAVAGQTSSGEFSWYHYLFLLGLFFLVTYYFAIGRYARKLGRSPIKWGGLAFLFSPLGIWISYLASLRAGKKDSARRD